MNFITKLWRGEYSLAKSYWLFSVVVSAVLSAPISVIEQLPSASLANIWIYGLIYIALYAAYMFIAAVGVWRAATVYTNGAVWKYLAKIYSAFTILSIAGVLIYFGQQVITNGLSSGSPTYSYFSCQNFGVQTKEECNPIYSASFKFTVNRDKSEVFLISTSVKTNQSNIIKLDSCVVVDLLNWQCGDPSNLKIDNGGNGIFQHPFVYRSIDGNVSTSNLTVSVMKNGKIMKTDSMLGGFINKN